MLQIRLPIDPPPGRVCDVEACNYGQILWPKPNQEWWSSEPNPCPLGEVGDEVKINAMGAGFISTWLVTSVQMVGGPQMALPELPWEWVITLTKKDCLEK